jgi:hypothetical protein
MTDIADPATALFKIAVGNGQVRTRKRAHLPGKIERAYRESESKRETNKTSRLDYAAGFEDGYNEALDDITEQFLAARKAMLKALKAP